MDSPATTEDRLMHFGAYRKALELFDLVVADMSSLAHQPALARLVGQQYASADSIASNIEEGYGRGSPKEYAHFLTIARGSARETGGRYRRMKHWLDESVVDARVRLCSEIVAILTSTTSTLRAPH